MSSETSTRTEKPHTFVDWKCVVEVCQLDQTTMMLGEDLANRIVCCSRCRTLYLLQWKNLPGGLTSSGTVLYGPADERVTVGPIAQARMHTRAVDVPAPPPKDAEGGAA